MRPGNGTGQLVLMVTDVPFWQGRTGAQQRILSLARFLSREPFRLVTFYCGQVQASDPERIGAAGLEVEYFDSQRPPEAFLDRLRWYADATRNQLAQLLGGREAPVPASAPSPLRIADYRWPWAIAQFRSLVRRIRPQVVIAQYVTMSWLLEALSPEERAAIRCVVDTHDILHDRARQFGTAGYCHWLEISQEEEAALWAGFDAVLAIQEDEADLIRRLAPGPEVLLAPHTVDGLEQEVAGCDRRRAHRPPPPDGEVVVGYIGSANYSNWHAINRFLIEAWPELGERHPRVRLIIAGGITEWFRQQDPSGGFPQGGGIELLDAVPDLSAFYGQVDVVVNPVLFGTGLKIKNIEAMAFGLPLVTTVQGAAGMGSRAAAACRVARDLPDMARLLEPLLRDRESGRQLGAAARQVAWEEFSERRAFAGLRQFLLRGA